MVYSAKLPVYNVIFFTFQASQCWRAALEFTTRFLTAHGQGVGQKGQRALHTHKTLQVRTRKLYLTSLYALVTFQMSLVEPWFVFWRDTAEPEYPWRDQMTLKCRRSVPKR